MVPAPVLLRPQAPAETPPAASGSQPPRAAPLSGLVDEALDAQVGVSYARLVDSDLEFATPALGEDEGTLDWQQVGGSLAADAPTSRLGNRKERTEKDVHRRISKVQHLQREFQRIRDEPASKPGNTTSAWAATPEAELLAAWKEIKTLQDADKFRAGTLYENYHVWKAWLGPHRAASAAGREVLGWIKDGLTILWVNPSAPAQQRHPQYKKCMERARRLLIIALGSEKVADAALSQSTPPNAHLPNSDKLREHADLIRKKDAEYLNTGAWEKCERTDIIMVNRLTVADAKPGKEPRPCLDTAVLNVFTPYTPFQYETLADVTIQAAEGDFGTTTDLKSGYHHVRLRPSMMPYFGVEVAPGQFRRFRVLPFGWRDACRVFTRVMGEVYRPLRMEYGIRLTFLIDDEINLAQGKGKAGRQGSSIALLLALLGFHVGQAKSELDPQQKLRFLGMLVDLLEQCIRVPEDKKTALAKLLRTAAESPQLPAKEIASVSGKILSHAWGLPLSPLFTRDLYRALLGRVNWKSLLPTRVEWRVLFADYEQYMAEGNPGRFFPTPSPYRGGHGLQLSLWLWWVHPQRRAHHPDHAGPRPWRGRGGGRQPTFQHVW